MSDIDEMLIGWKSLEKRTGLSRFQLQKYMRICHIKMERVSIVKKSMIRIKVDVFENWWRKITNSTIEVRTKEPQV